MGEDRVEEFTGKWEFLSNEFWTQVGLENQVYPSVAHAFQAARTSDPELRQAIAKCVDFPSLYALCEDVDNPPDWNKQRVMVMEKLIREKFRRSRELQRRLLETGQKQLINSYTESNSSNLFWGMVGSRGQNQVGSLLMKTRTDIENGREVEAWLVACFDIQTDIEELPSFRVTGYKNERKVERETLENKPYYLIGSSSRCRLQLEHPSVSRKHACLFVDRSLGPILVDLHSKAGTFLNGSAVKQGVAVPINGGDEVRFGESERTYRVELDYGDVEETLERKKRKLDEELKALEAVETHGDFSQLHHHLGVPVFRSIRLQRLSYHCREADISQLLSVCGEIEQISLHRGRSHSTAIVRFTKAESAKNAVKYDGLLFQGRNITVTIEEKGEDSQTAGFE